MKKICLFLVLGLFIAFPVAGFCSTAKIIDLRGKVMVKFTEGDWKRAEINMVLGKDAEIETQEDSFCTLAFDEERKNVLTIKANSRLKIEDVKPGSLFLPQGRVFTLIENLAKQEKFQIRTPTAVAAARGTGWMTDHHSNQSKIHCFLDTVQIQGLDDAGNTTEETDLNSGKGLGVGEGGVFGEVYGLGGMDYEEWNDFAGYLDDLNKGKDSSGSAPEGASSLEDSLKQQRGDFGELQYEELRRQREGTSSGGQDYPDEHKDEPRDDYRDDQGDDQGDDSTGNDMIIERYIN